MSRRAFKFLGAVAGLAALALGSIGPARAEDWPARRMSMIVAAAAGGPIDVFGRIFAERLGDVLGQPVIIENVGGAGGMLGGQRAAQAAPDGYTFILGTIATHTFAQLLYRKPLYDARTDFAPVGLIADIPLVLLARKDFPADDLPGFIAYVKSHPGKLNFGSAGAGSASHLGCLLLNSATGLEATHVPYKGTGPAMADLIGGQIDYMCEIMVTAAPQIQANTIKAFANLSGQRSSMLPNLPTAAEKGVAGAQAYTWTAIFLPKGAPPAIVAKLHDAAVKVMDMPDVKERLANLGATIVGPDRRSPDDLAKFVKDEIAKWAGPVKASGAISD